MLDHYADSTYMPTRRAAAMKKSMFASQTLPRFNVRLTATLKAWVAQEAAARKCPMNTVILDALSMTMNQALREQLRREHDAAVRLAISIAQLPKGTAIVLQTEQHDLITDILVREPFQTNYSILARVHGEQVVFADNTAETAENGSSQ